MRHVLALAGWSEVAVSVDAWWDTDREGRPVTLSYVGDTAGHASQAPVTNEDGSVCVALAGSIYNARELRATLSREHAVRDHDDAEVVVHLYEERDVQCMQALRGAFAIVLWDVRRRRLVLARDQLGLLPMYYATEGRRCAASSSLSSLARLPGLREARDMTALDAFLTLGTVPPPATFHPGIRQLHPAEVLVWEDGRPRGRRYWQLHFPERRVAEAAVPGLLRDGVIDALRLRQGATTPALLLSGGLGAGAVLALAVADQRPPGRAYTASGVDVGADDARLAARLAHEAGVAHTVVDDPLDWAAALDALLEQGGPVGGLDVPLVALAASRAATEFPVALVGAGGDEVFGGSAPARIGERVRHFRRLPALVREGAEVWARLAPRRWAGGVGSLVRNGRLAPLEMYARTVSRFLPEDREELYTPEVLALLGETQAWGALTGLFPDAVAAGAEETADAVHHVELTLRLPARIAALRAAAPGLDLRVPLADHRLASLVASLAPADRGTARARQVGLARALVGQLPRALLRRGHHISVPSRAAWSTGSLRALLEDLLAPARLESQGVFRSEAVGRLVREHLAGRADHGERLWALLQVTRWLERQRWSIPSPLRAVG